MELRQTHINLLSDKDYQLVSKIYRRTAEQFYENPEDPEYLSSLSCITSLIPEIVAVKAGLQSLTVISQMEILRAKTKGNRQLKQKLAFAIGHLKNPKSLLLSKKYLIEAFSKEELYLLACTIALRYIKVLKEDCEMDWKIVIDFISQNIDKEPLLTIELLIEVCKQDQQNARLVTKSGIVKYIFVEYLQKNLKEKYNLYKGIKLIKVTSVDRSVVRERQKTLGLLIYTYGDYIPAISEISSRCYDSEYCSIVVNKNIFECSGIDYAFVWSYVELFARHQLNQDIIGRYLKLVSSQKVSSEMEAKIFAIFGNYCKFCKCVSKQMLKITPKYQESLLFYLKMCFNMSIIDVSSPHYINWNQVSDLLLANSNPKAQEIANYLKDIMNTKARVGSLNPHFVRMFAVDRNADMLLDRAAKVPKNNEDLENIKSILKQKVGSNELDTDTLNLAKEKALQSIRRAVALKRKIDINSILGCLELGNIYQVSQFLKILEMYLTIFEDEAQKIDKNRVVELIQWVQDHYTGQIIDWGSISQLLLILCSQDEWKKELKNLQKYCFWILSIDQLDVKDQQKIWNTVNSWDANVLKKKLPYVLGFLGKVYNNLQRASSCKKNIKSLESIVQNIANSQDYNVNLMMLSYFLRGWGRDQDDYSHQKHKKTFEQLIKPVVNIITSHPRQSPQENYLLESCLPYKVDTSKVTTDLEGLIKTNGKLASQIYSEQSKKSKKVSQIKVSNLENESAGEIGNVLIFAQENPNALKSDQINRLVRRIENEPNCYWQLFPRYMDIMTAIVEIVGQSENEHIKKDLSSITTSLINEVITNPDITDDQRQQLLEVTRDSFQSLGERGVYLQIERIKTIVRKIVDQEIREEILIILNNYKIKEEPKVQIPLIEQFEERSKMEMPSIAKKWLQNEQKRQLFQVQEQIQPQRNNQMTNQFTAEQNYFSTKAKPLQEVKPVPLESMFQSIKNSNNLSLIEAFEVLKKIANKEHPNQKFNEIYEVFSKNPLSTYQKQILGILLSKLYNVYQCPKVLSLILDKQKTYFNKLQIFKLVSQHVPAFALCKREKLLGREYLDVAIQRVRQNFFAQGCEVASYNLNQISDLQYFYKKLYHNKVLELVQNANLQDEIAQLLLLIGRAAKFPQIRNEWLSKYLHTRILKFIDLFPKSIKIIGNLSFAQSSLTNQQIVACADIVTQKSLMYTYLQSVKIEPSNSNVANYASEFINNLCTSKSFEEAPDFNIQTVISTLKILFASNIESENIAPYKYILKAIGFLSLTYSSDFLEEDFCQKIILFSEKLDIITSYDQKKAKITHLLIDLIINLSKNKERRLMLHNYKITLLTVTLLETIESEHPEIIATCIDAINALCQESVIEKWYVIEKRLPYILLDILKLQSEETLVLKAMRMAHNITLNTSCIPTILKSNILGVIANIVIPHIGLHRLSVENEQFCKKVELFIIKMITKIYEAKPPLERILKGGFLDCLVRLIEMSEVQENIFDILFYYSSHIPSFLNRRTFSSLIKILTVKVTDRKALVKCLQSLRNILSFSYQAQQEDNIIQGISDMYLKFIATEFTEDALFLLFYHLMRSLKFRELLRSPQDKIQQQLLKLADQEKYKEICRTIIFLIYSPPPKMYIQMSVNTKVEGMQYETMRAGIRCWLYRADGSYKEAKIDIDQQYNFRVYKAPDGEIKNKYTTNIKHIRQFQIEFQSNKQLWSRSIFQLQKGMFHNSKPENCCTLISNQAWGNIKMINIQFLTYQDKIAFFTCFTYLLAIFRL